MIFGIPCFVNLVKRVTCVVTLVVLSIVGSFLLLTSLNGCAQPATTAITDAKFEENNQTFSFIARELINQDPIFKQALAKVTIDTFDADHGNAPATEDEVYIDTNSGQICDVMDDYLPIDNNYRNEVAAIIFSALNANGRQALADQLGPDDPVFLDPEVTRLLPENNPTSTTTGSELLSAA